MTSTAHTPGDSGAPGTSREITRLRGFVIASLVALVVLLLVPSTLRGVVYLLFAVGAIAVTAAHCFGLRGGVRRPALLICVAAASSVTASVVRSLHSSMSGGDYPFPSVADVFVFFAYGCFLGAIVTIVRRRSPHFNGDAALDAVVAGVAVAVVQWTVVLLPYLQDAANSPAARWTNVAYAMVSLLLVMAAVLALVTGSIPTPSNRLLAAGLVMTFLMDVIATAVTAGALPDQVLLAAGMILLTLGGAGLMHPSVRSLVQRPSGLALARSLTRRRVAVLAVALVTPPTLLLYEVLRENRGVQLVLPAAGSVALAPLVLVRLGRLVRQNERLASLELTLRSVGERLVGAETELDVTGIITAGLEQVLGDALVAGRFLVGLHRSDMRARAKELSPAVEALLREAARRGDARPLITGEVVAADVEGAGEWVVGAVMVRRRLRGALVVVSSRPLNDIESNAVVSLCREAAIALRAVERTESHVRRRSEERFASLVTNSSDIVCILDGAGNPIYVSPAVEHLLGWDPSDERLAGIVHPEDVETLDSVLDDAAFGHRRPAEVRLRHALGPYEWFEVSAVDLRNDPNIGGIVLNARAIGDRKVAEEQLRMSEARFKALVQNSSDVVLVVDSHDRIRYASPSAARTLGESVEDLTGRVIGGAFRGSEVNWETALRSAQRDQPDASTAIEFGFRDPGGHWVQMEAIVTDLRGDPAVGGFVINARNVTERRRMMQRLRYQATHDSLTGLPNRILAGEELAGMLSRNEGSSTVAVLSLDLDDFKDINDSLGHAAGDQLLMAVAERLKDSLAFGDMAARSGGDEFLVVLERAHGESDVLAMARSLLDSLDQPFVVDGRELRLTTSMGVVFDHDRRRGAEALLRDAEIAMYRAKRTGGHSLVVFEPHMRAASFDRLELRADLLRALGSEQFVVHYQPVIDLFSGRVLGVEALVRWDHPRRGLLGPAVFVPTAEELGVVDRLGRWVLDRACRDLTAWREDLPALAAELSVAVNLSAQELHSPKLLETVTSVLTRTGLDAGSLVLEVTESNLLNDTEVTRERIRRLRRLGARLAIDDFGTGYSSLGYIQSFDFDILKIDRTFVEGLDNPTNVQIVTAVIELASQLGVRVIAEGIETVDQAQLLMQLGCRYGQGFLYARPVGEAEFRSYLVSSTRSLH